MKSLAILKDSLREAIDNKVLYVLVGLSLLVVLFMLTCSFEPLPAEETMQRVCDGKLMDWVEMFDPSKAKRGRRPVDGEPKKEAALGEFRVLAAEPSAGAADSPTSAYRVRIGLRVADETEAAQVRRDPDAALRRLRGRFTLAERLELFRVGAVRVAEAPRRDGAVKAGEPVFVHFEIMTEPTPNSRLVWNHQVSLFLGAVPVGDSAPLGLVLFFATIPVLWFGSLVAILTGVIVTGFFIPNMLRKGAVDLLLVKPISRPTLLIYKYLGGLIFILVNTSIAVGGLWLALGLRSGVWANSFLLMIFTYTFFFAILYSVSTLCAVLTRSVIASILITCGAWFLFFIVGALHGVYEQQRMVETIDNVPEEKRSSTAPFWSVVRVLHFVLPRPNDVENLGTQALMAHFIPSRPELARVRELSSITWGESLAVSCGFIVVMLGLASWRFARKDF